VPDARVSMIDACGHAPHIEKTGLVSDKIFAFLDRVQA
jgi:pimeloyl-ACP methyl ester carboxylesterase